MKELKVNRRDFLRLSGIATVGVLAAACGTAAIPEASTGGTTPAAGTTPGATAAAPAAAGNVSQVARNKSLIMMFGGDGTQYTDVGLGSPYATGYTHQMGNNTIYEPLVYYSAFADAFTPWIATDSKYNDDFTELTINLRDGVLWNDGTAYNADDVVFTLQMLKDNAPLLANSAAVGDWIDKVEAVDNLTVHITFKQPKPRFMFGYLTYKYDTGIDIVPKHVFEGQKDFTAFTGYTEGKGSVGSGAYNIVSWTPQQKIMDLLPDWWAAKTGFAKLPVVERQIFLPYSNDTTMLQMVVTNEVDATQDLRATTIPQAVEQNPKVITHTGREKPYGYIDWWPTSMWFDTSDGPFATKEMRWAVSYSIDRQQMLDVALGGSGTLTELPFPYYKPLVPFFDATKDLLTKYPTNEFSLDKAAALMQGMGYAKNGDGLWAKDGATVPTSIAGWGVFVDIGPVIAEQLRKGGFDAEFVTPPDAGTRESDGTQKIWLNGHGGSINDPFDTLDYFTSKYYAAEGQPTAQNSRYKNPEYDKILDQMAVITKDDPKYMGLYLQAIEIYLSDLVDAPIQQWMHRIPMNTTYWEGWPTADNPYLNGAFWHQTWPLILQKLTATGA